ncbi:MAG: class I SAM-dependent methyltransferase, partial [Thermoplasmata archaeon]
YRVFADFIFLNAEEPKIVLDVASGPGILSCALAERWKDAKIVGLDISMEMIEYAKERARRKGCNNLEFVIGDALALPFKTELFDLIVCRGFLKVVSSPVKLLDECCRVLKPGGKMCFSDTYYEGLSLLPEICRKREEYGVLEEALKHSLRLSEIRELFSEIPSSIFLRGISVYILARKRG